PAEKLAQLRRQQSVELRALEHPDARAQVDARLAHQVSPVAELLARIRAVVAGDDEAHAPLDERIESHVLEVRAVGQVPAVAPATPEAAGELREEASEGGASLQALPPRTPGRLPQRRRRLPPVAEPHVEQCRDHREPEAGLGADTGGEGRARDRQPVAQLERPDRVEEMARTQGRTPPRPCGRITSGGALPRFVA